MANSPYKFLDHYGIDDAANFFGRERETEILLSDIVSMPLVLLFAKTGSGKSSLINAGVRPRLEQLGYRTFYIRVEKDPTKSAREALKRARLLPPRVVRRSLDFQLADAQRRIKKPMVLFFDQFEEFFLYIYDKSPEKARKFISTVAELYGNRDSGVHLVFSFREEFFIEMDAFREQIPTIFHNDSNLRLRWLEKSEAREAISGPARKARFKIEPALIERLLSDLAENERIEPARLQIICDTLWRERTKGQATLADYERMGGATRILDWRLSQDINKHLDDGQLRLLRKLVPQLANVESGTKYVRGLNELTESVDTSKEDLRSLIDKLKELHLIRESTRYGEIYIEWTSDYLAERTQYLEQRVHATSLRRLISDGLDRQRKAKKKKRITLSSELDLWTLYFHPKQFEAISAGASVLGDLSTEELEFLFEASLEHGSEMELWFQKATQNRKSRKNVWRMVEDKILNQNVRVEQAENAVRLLGSQRTGQAMRLLKKALQQEALASITIAVLGEMRTTAAMDILRGAVTREDLANQIISTLSQIRTNESVKILNSLLSDERLSEHAERSLERLSKVGVSKASVLAKKVLLQWRHHRSRKVHVGSAGRPDAQVEAGSGLGTSDWFSLLHKIRDGVCTVFLGDRLNPAGSSLNSVIASWLAKTHGFPGADKPDLSKVAQYLSVKYDRAFALKTIAKAMAVRKASVDSESYKVCRELADLPVTLYITTNYDDQIERALTHRGKAAYSLSGSSGEFKMQESIGRGDPKRPIVYHLLGDFMQPESIAVTEDDQLSVLYQLGRRSLPGNIAARLTKGSQLFIGYDQSDLTLRVLLQGVLAPLPLTSSMHYIQLASVAAGISRSPEYAEQYFRQRRMKTYWGSPRQLMEELMSRWRLLGFTTF